MYKRQTVSRAVSGKYLQCPQGVFELRYFFSGSSSFSGRDGQETCLLYTSLVFADPTDYDMIKLGDKLVIENAAAQVENEEIIVKNETTGKEYRMIPNLSELEKKMILSGGKINMLKNEE